MTADLLTPLEKIYYLRVVLGIVAALAGTAYGYATGSISNTNFNTATLFNGITIMLVVYLLSYYAVKAKYASQVAKPTKLMTTGIGVYLLAWIVLWVFLYTIIAGPPATSLALGL